MHFQGLGKDKMKNVNLKKLIATLGAAALISTGLVVAVAAPAQASTPVCVEDAKTAVITCDGTLANGAKYRTMVPSNYGGTFFFWQHGVRPSYPYPGYVVPTGVEQMSPTSVNHKVSTVKPMLQLGYGIAAYDCSSSGLRGWNTADCVEMLNELVTITKKRVSITKTVVYGASMAGAILTPYIEKYPNGADAVGVLAGVSPSIANTLKSGCDFLYIFSVFFDPTIKGCTVMGTKGVPGHMAVLGDFAKVGALLTKWSVDYGSLPIAYPAPLAAAGIPQRSALLLAGLIAGIPTKSAHMDGISTSATFVPEGSINSTVAILENAQDFLGTAYFGGQGVAEVVGAGFYDNTKTDFSALLSDEDLGRFTVGLSGEEAVGAMLATLAAYPRVQGVPAAVAKLAALDKSKFDTTKPVVLLSNEADRLVLPGNQVHYVNKAKAVYEARVAAWEKRLAEATDQPEIRFLLKNKPVWNTVSMYALTPETYTKFTATGAPDLTAPVAISGVGHESFTKEQLMTWVRVLASSAKTGKVPSQTVLDTILPKVPHLNTDPDYQPAELKYQD
jgi:pimeloyl-ACP methyl ester carboxylesterase